MDIVVSLPEEDLRKARPRVTDKDLKKAREKVVKEMLLERGLL